MSLFSGLKRRTIEHVAVLRRGSVGTTVSPKISLIRRFLSFIISLLPILTKIFSTNLNYNMNISRSNTHLGSDVILCNFI